MASFRIGTIDLGDKVFYSSQLDRYILADSLFGAQSILEQQRLKGGPLEFICQLTDASKLLHKGGCHVYIVHGHAEYVADTILVCGSPKGMDTRKHIAITYVR